MAGTFELFVDAEAAFRFRLKAPDGTVMVVSKAYADKPAAVAGITAVREYAGMGHIADLCLGASQPGPTAQDPVGGANRLPASERGKASGLRQAGNPRRLSGVT